MFLPTSASALVPSLIRGERQPLIQGQRAGAGGGTRLRRSKGVDMTRRVPGVALVLGVLGSWPIAGRSQSMREQAQYAIQRPAKVDVLTVDQLNETTRPVRIQVVLRASAGQPIAAQEATSVEVTATQPSGQVVRQSVVFAPGESSKTTELPIIEAGVTKLRARHDKDQLLESTNYVNVAPMAGTVSSPKKRSKKIPKTIPRHSELRWPQGFASQGRLPRLVRAALYQAPNQPTAFPSSGAVPQLMLKVSGENDADGVRADGVAFARVQVFYMGDTPPPRDIKVWVSPSNGEISANPIIIPKDQLMGEAHWTSKAPIAAAKLTIAGTNPKLPFVGSTEATVVFGAPILGIGLLNPPSRITIVDSVTLTAAFFDAEGTPTPTKTKREYRFVSNSPILHLQPDHAAVDPDTPDFSTVATPTFIGESQIEVVSPGYISKPQKVRVTGLVVLLLCIVGGILGGLLAFMNSQGKLWARLVAGVIVGAVACWAYVFLGLPNVQSMILHTQISVLFVSILAAFAGVKVLSVITRALSLGF